MKLFLCVVSLVLIVGLTGCSNISVSTDYDTSADFTKYKTFAWIPEPTANNSTTNNPLIADRIKNAVTQDLTAKGYKLDNGNPDFLIAYHTGTQQQLEVDDWGYGVGMWGGGLDAYTYTEGTLILDFVDAKSKQLMWRGTAQGVVGQESAQASTENIDTAVGELIEKFPPKPKK